MNSSSSGGKIARTVATHTETKALKFEEKHPLLKKLGFAVASSFAVEWISATLTYIFEDKLRNWFFFQIPSFDGEILFFVWPFCDQIVCTFRKIETLVSTSTLDSLSNPVHIKVFWLALDTCTLPELRCSWVPGGMCQVFVLGSVLMAYSSGWHVFRSFPWHSPPKCFLTGMYILLIRPDELKQEGYHSEVLSRAILL